MLAARTEGDGPHLVLVHGFTQTGAVWAPVAGLLTDRFTVTTVDAPGHGGSTEIRADLVEGAEQVGRAGGRATYVGYSMGGRLTLHLALQRPELVDALVLVSATAGIDDPSERAERRRRDEALADRLEREGVEAFVRWWLTLPLFADLPASAASVEARATNTAAGLASSLRLAGTGTQAPLWDRLAELAMPVLVVAGSRDEAYLARAERLVAGIGGNATLTVLEAGHSVPLIRPAELAAAIDAWRS